VSDTKVDKYSQVADNDIRDIIFDKVVNRGDTPILKELSIKIWSRRRSIGRVGGKSTLANVLMRLDDIDAGRIMYGDSDITSYSLKSGGKCFPHTSTSQVEEQDSTRERSYAADVTAEDVDRVLRESGLNHVADAFKPRYDKTVGGKMLLGGQRQIVWLMRSLLDRTCRHVGRAHQRP
jgi:ATP-binding cassette subfamily B protein